VIGSDVFGAFDELPAKLDRFEQLLDELSGRDAECVRHENAERLWFG
jgi:hypothetical protein